MANRREWDRLIKLVRARPIETDRYTPVLPISCLPNLINLNSNSSRTSGRRTTLLMCDHTIKLILFLFIWHVPSASFSLFITITYCIYHGEGNHPRFSNTIEIKHFEESFGNCLKHSQQVFYHSKNSGANRARIFDLDKTQPFVDCTLFK